MSGLISDCERLFGTVNLYEVLSLQKKASAVEVKKAYYKLSLLTHPDKVETSEKDTATEKFKVLSQIYAILSDDEKRKLYDDTELCFCGFGMAGLKKPKFYTWQHSEYKPALYKQYQACGSVDDDLLEDDDKDWFQYWRILFPKISVKNIEQFEKSYKGSQEELNDLSKAYLDSAGDMDRIIDTVLCATVADEPRFRDAIKRLIDSGDLPSFDLFINEPARKRTAREKKSVFASNQQAPERGILIVSKNTLKNKQIQKFTYKVTECVYTAIGERAEKERKEAEEMEKMNKNESLESLILARKTNRENNANSFFAQLEEKYCKPKTNAKSKPSKSATKGEKGAVKSATKSKGAVRQAKEKKKQEQNMEEDYDEENSEEEEEEQEPKKKKTTS